MQDGPVIPADGYAPITRTVTQIDCIPRRKLLRELCSVVLDRADNWGAVKIRAFTYASERMAAITQLRP